MKKSFLLLLLILFSCGGRPDVKDIPEHLTVGIEEMIKGNSFYQNGCYKMALDKYFKAYKYFVVSDQIKNSAKVLNNIGNVYRVYGDNKSALLFFDEAGSLYESLDDNKGIAQTSSNKAASYISLDDFKKARSILLTSIREMENEKIFVPSLERNLGIMYLKMGNFEKAEMIFNQIQKRNSENEVLSSSLYFAIGDLKSTKKQFKKAIVNYEKALQIDKQSGFFVGIAQDLNKIGSAYESLDKMKKAYIFLKRSLMVYTVLGMQKKSDELLKKIKIIEPKDVSVDSFFIKKWIKGDETPCQ